MTTLPGITCIDDGDNSWVLVATILVLGMMPALAFFELGLLRSKNTLSLVSQIFGGLVALGFLWDIIGFSLVYGDTLGGVIGKPWQYWVLIDVGYDNCHQNAPTIPAASFALFQMMFAAITPLLMTGAYAERVNWRSFFLFTILWEILVYYPVAHWIWGGGWLDQMGVLDFAGGIVIHTSAGVGGLVVAIIIGRRKGFEKFHGEFPPSNIPLAALGAALLWMGWFGFNAGSALTSGSTATSAVASTQIAACTSGMVWLLISWFRAKPSSVAIINGVIAGLAGITPASGYISSQATLLVGLILGIASYFSCHLIKGKLKIDDALDVSSVHGLTGVIGSLMIGIFSEKSLNPNGADGMIHGQFRLFGVQVLAVVVVAVYSAVITAVLVLAMKRFIGFRVSESEEEVGVDYSQHGEIAYTNLHAAENIQDSLHLVSNENTALKRDF